MELNDQIKVIRYCGVVLELVVGMLICKSNMNPFVKAFLTIAFAEDTHDLVAKEIKKTIKQYESKTEET